MRSCLQGQTRRSLIRSIHLSRSLLSAQKFTMPAMSPTMEKGGIVSWKFKVGEPFSSGDVLLEVETDKAQIDVEAQDDGKLAKILKGDGSKDVDVGETIAYLADVDDDLSTLKISAEEEEQVKVTPVSKVEEKTTSGNKEPLQNTKKAKESPIATDKNGVLQVAKSNQTLLPSVSLLLAANNISKEDAIRNIKASGRDGLLLKGDVLAYLGKIPESSLIKVSEYVKNKEKQDFSHIELGSLTKAEPPQSEKLEDKAIEKISKEPVLLHSEITLKVPSNVSRERLDNTVKSFIEEGFEYTHAMPLSNINSQYFDDIFEDLITTAPREPRFQVNYELYCPVEEEERFTRKDREDIFDLLAGSESRTPLRGPVVSNSEASTPASEWTLSLELEVSDKYSDSKQKAERFLEYMWQLDLS